MKTIPISFNIDCKYFIKIHKNMMSNLDHEIENLISSKIQKIVVITDTNCINFYKPFLMKKLKDMQYYIISLAPGEQSKLLESAISIWQQFISFNFSRRDLVVAFGGGVVCDTAGWIAATYMRGVPYINIPTSLVAQLDAAIGGKVAINA